MTKYQHRKLRRLIAAHTKAAIDREWLRDGANFGNETECDKVIAAAVRAEEALDRYITYLVGKP